MTVPSFTLSSDARMPAIGLGTFGSDRYTPDQVAAAVADAIELGYRHIDCAAVYGNEKEVGAAIKRSGISRENLWITSKLWNDKHDPADVAPACERSLEDLGCGYLDLYLIHWPFPHHHRPGVDVGSRDPHARPYSHKSFMATWREMEKLLARGLTKHIGTSNMTKLKLERLLREAEVKPAANEMELHPHFQQPELLRFVKEQAMLPIAYCPLGSPSRPERDRTPADTVDLEDPVLQEISAESGLSPAGVSIRWAIQRGSVPIPFSTKRAQYEESLMATMAPELSEAQMARLSAIDRNCRLIKGQVFLWPGAASWEELWD